MVAKGVTYATYAHFSSFEQAPDGIYAAGGDHEQGATVLRGTKLGYVGDTGHSHGPHLHFQIDKDSGREHPDWFGDPDWPYTEELEWYTWEPTKFIDSHKVMLALSQSRGDYYSGMDFDGEWRGCHCANEDKEVDFEWGYGPAPFNLYDEYSVRWSDYWEGQVATKFCVNTSKDTLFILTTDDGARVWVDGELIFDAWYDQPPSTYGYIKGLSAGEHTLRVDYYENTYHSVIQVAWGNDPCQ